MAAPELHVEVASATLAPADDEAVRRLVTAGDAEARGARVPDDVVCLVREDDGAVVGASTAVPADVELVGGRRFAIYGDALAPDAARAHDALLSATFAALDAAFDPEVAGAPIGLCLLLASREEMARRPQAQWTAPPLLYAGYLDDGRQVRVGYFAGALITAGDPRG